MSNTITRNWKSWSATSFIIGLWSLCALASYWAFMDNSPAFVSRIHQVETEVQRGNVAVLYSDIDWLRQCSIYSDRILILKIVGTEYMVGTQSTIITKDMVGKSVKDNAIIIYIPHNLPTGDYWVERRTQIVCNPIHRLWPIQYVSTRAPLHVR